MPLKISSTIDRLRKKYPVGKWVYNSKSPCWEHYDLEKKLTGVVRCVSYLDDNDNESGLCRFFYYPADKNKNVEVVFL